MLRELKIFSFTMEEQSSPRQIRRTGSDRHYSFGQCYDQYFCVSQNYRNKLNLLSETNILFFSYLFIYFFEYPSEVLFI